MSTISFSVEEGLKRDIAAWAKRAKKSKSDLLRDMATAYSFNQRLEVVAAKTDKVLAELGITSETDLFKYLASDETYTSRLRHKRLPGRR